MGTAIRQTVEHERAPHWSLGRAARPRAPRVGPDLIMATLCLNLLSLAMPLALLQVYDRIVPNQSRETLLLIGLGLLCVIALESGLKLVRAYVVAWAAARFEHRTAQGAADRLLGSDIATFETVTPGRHLENLNATDTLRDFHAGQSRLLIMDLPFLVLFLGLIWLIAGTLVVVPLGLLGMLGALELVIGRMLQTEMQEGARVDERRHNFIIDVLGGIETIKLMAMEPLMQRRYERLQLGVAERSERIVLLSNLAQSVGSTFTQLTMAAVAGVGALMVIDNQLSIGGLAACTLLSGRTMQPLQRLLGLWTRVQGFRIANERLDRVFETKPEDPVDREPFDTISGAFELKPVDGAPFGAAEVSIAAGETIAIKGEAGSGRTTLLLTIANVMRPASGQVLFDGIDVTHRTPASLRRQIAYLPQSPVVFSGSILDNITMFRGPAAVESALAISKALGLETAVSRLPDGYETRIGDNADVKLPLGLRQRIAIVRALTGKPRLILFNAATSALSDQDTRTLIANIRKQAPHATLVLVSQRATVVELAQRRFELRDGLLLAEQQPDAPVDTDVNMDVDDRDFAASEGPGGRIAEHRS